MTGHSNHNDLIDSFLSGGMSTSEQAEFEHMLNSDPLLKEEFMFQKEIVNGIKEYRRDQMKHRLNQITIGVGVTGLLLNSGLSKVLAAVGTIGFIGVGSYFIVEELNSTNTPETISSLDLSIDSPKEFSGETFVFEMPLNEDVADINEQKQKHVAENNKITSSVAKTETTKVSIIVAEEESKEKLGISEEVEIAEKVKQANFNVPSMDELGNDEETLNGIDITLPDSNQPITTKEEASKEIEIENVRQTKYDLHYKFFSGKLFLYGDFNSIPYELLEINSGASRNLYLFHDSVYYQLSQFEKNVVPLKPIRDKELISELEIIRKNKID
ncbi:MAG: hypothetical protein NXI20_26245 [bacterium]|nr:hypothetical protein [bacterium]